MTVWNFQNFVLWKQRDNDMMETLFKIWYSAVMDHPEMSGEYAWKSTRCSNILILWNNIEFQSWDYQSSVNDISNKNLQTNKFTAIFVCTHKDHLNLVDCIRVIIKPVPIDPTNSSISVQPNLGLTYESILAIMRSSSLLMSLSL